MIWNSTPTLLQLLSMRSKKATYPQWSIHQLKGVRIPARVKEPNVIEVLAKIHDELAGQEIGRLQHAADDPVRHAIDAAVHALYGIDETLFSSGSTLSGRSLALDLHPEPLSLAFLWQRCRSRRPASCRSSS